MSKIYVFFIVFLILLTSCFKKSSDQNILIDFDSQKRINVRTSGIIFDPNAFSGSYVTYADSLSPYSFGILSNSILLDLKNKEVNLKLSGQIKRALAGIKASLDFQVVGKNEEPIFAQSVYINESNFTNPNEWVKVEGIIKLPNNPKIFNAENEFRIFLFNTKERVFLDDLALTIE